MNYQHSFHAGNFADVIKHIIYVYAIDYAHKKTTPLFLLDTHGGAGCYHLGSEAAEKTQEAFAGILKLKGLDDGLPALIRRYMDIINPFLNENDYPGSPMIAAELLRDDDILRCCELHPTVYHSLQDLMKQISNAHITHESGYYGMKGYLPPSQKRGIILIDPPFENETEFDDCLDALTHASKRFMNGTYIIWYPIKEMKKVTNFRKGLMNIPGEKLEVTAYLEHPDFENKLNKCGVTVINPPFGLSEALADCQKILHEVMKLKLQIKNYKI